MRCQSIISFCLIWARLGRASALTGVCGIAEDGRKDMAEAGAPHEGQHHKETDISMLVSFELDRGGLHIWSLSSVKLNIFQN